MLAQTGGSEREAEIKKRKDCFRNVCKFTSLIDRKRSTGRSREQMREEMSLGSLRTTSVTEMPINRDF